jgi:hypothetical protein
MGPNGPRIASSLAAGLVERFLQDGTANNETLALGMSA